MSLTLVNDYTYDLNGLLIGAGTSYKVMKIDGLFSLPDVSEGDVKLEGFDGEASPAPSSFAARTVTIDLALMQESEGEAELLNEELAKHTSMINVPFQFQIRRPNTPLRYVTAKIRRRNFSVDWEFSRGTPQGTIELKANDPLIYEIEEQTSGPVTSQKSAGGGRTYPKNYPYNYQYQGLTNGTTNCINTGSYPTPARIVVRGNSGVFTVENLTQSRTLFYNGTIALNDSVTFNTNPKSRSVLLNNQVSVRKNLQTSQWFLLNPGNNEIRFNAVIPDPTNEPVMEIFWKSAWA